MYTLLTNLLQGSTADSATSQVFQQVFKSDLNQGSLLITKPTIICTRKSCRKSLVWSLPNFPTKLPCLVPNLIVTSIWTQILHECLVNVGQGQHDWDESTFELDHHSCLRWGNKLEQLSCYHSQVPRPGNLGQDISSSTLHRSVGSTENCIKITTNSDYL